MPVIGGNTAWAVFTGSPIAFAEATGLAAASRAGVRAAALKFYENWTTLLNYSAGSGIRYTEALRTVKVMGTWRVVGVGPRATPHTASAPQHPPAAETGASAKSIQASEDTGGDWVVYSTSKSLLYLEYGVGGPYVFGPHKAGIVIEPRPHARPALEATLNTVTNDVAVAAFSELVNRAFQLRLSDQFTAIRRALVNISEVIGWVSAFGFGGPWTNTFRRGMLKIQRGLGDADAVIKGEVGARLVRRAAGHYAGKTIGATARALAPNSQFGRRVVRNYYGRKAGRILRRIY